MGIAKPSFVKGLLDDYEATGVKDPQHEKDMIALGGMVFTGQNILVSLNTSASDHFLRNKLDSTP